ncbi:MAG TPA: cupin domain-containing protein [Jatrophihabitans sp.]|jgi:gentisate 1,2-dioxygenase
MTLFEKTLADAALQRLRSVEGAKLVSRDEATAESTVMGLMRWYLHPDLYGPTTRSLYFHELSIEAGGRSGRLQTQGGQVHFVLTGAGFTELDGTRNQWEAGDVIAIPIRELGVTYQHFNDGHQAARLLVVWPNLDSALGPEAGVEMRVLEPASAYKSKPGEGTSTPA